MSRATEAFDVSIDGGGSCGLVPRRLKELHTKVVAAEGTAHESCSNRSFGPICQRQRKRSTFPSVTEGAAHGSDD